MRRSLVLPVLGLVLAGGLEAQSVTARLGGELTGIAGSRLLVPVTVDMRASGGQRLGSYTARVTWPARVLSFCLYCGIDSMLGTFAPPQVNADSAAYGVLKFTSASPLGADGEVVLARLPFYVNFDSAATLELSFNEMSASGTFTNLLPILTAQGGQFCPARGRYGDLDGDERSNSRDALLVLSHVVGLPVDTMVGDVTLGDVDADAQVTSRDALIILSYAVGLAIPGQRVLVMAPTACATGSPRFVRVVPDTAELVPGQPVLVVATASDSAGRPVALTDVSWRTSDPNIAFVEANGVVIGRAPGTASITAEAGPGLRATVHVNVIPRRPNWYVNLTAIGNAVQLGTAALPFAQPADAFRYVSEGDTVRIAPGTYLVMDDGEMWRGAVIVGGTPGDTTTRPVLRDRSAYSVLWLRGGRRTEVHNVAFENAYNAVDIESARELLLRDVVFRWSAGNYGYAVYHCGSTLTDTIRIERSTFLGDSINPSGYGVYVSGCVSPRSVNVLAVVDSRFRHTSAAIDGYDIDSIHIERTVFDGVDDYAVFSGNEYGQSYGAIVLRNSRILRNYWSAIYGYDLRRVVVDSSYIETRFDGAIYVSGDCCGGGPPVDVVLRRDTLVMRAGASYDEWLAVYEADSVLVTDVVVRGVADTSTAIQSYFDDVNWARIQRSRFLDAGSGSYVINGYDVRRLEIDSVEVVACPLVCCWGAYGVWVGGYSPRTASLTRSRFSNVAYAVQGFGSGARYDVHNVEVDSAYTGMYFDDVDSLNVTDNVLRRITYRGLDINDQLGMGGPLVIARDSVSCSPTYSHGLYLSNSRVHVERNHVSGCAGAGIYGYYLGPSLILGNKIRGNGSGVYLYGSADTSIAVRVDSNAVSQNTDGMYILGPRLTARGNNVRGNLAYGIGLHLSTAGRVHRLEGNAFQGNVTAAVYSPYDSTDASGNWWGVDGAAPGTAGADAVAGRVNASNPLASEPAVPPLAPPSLRTPVAAVAEAAPPPARTMASGPGVQPRTGSPRAAPVRGRDPSAELGQRDRERERRLEVQRQAREQRRALRRQIETEQRQAASAPQR
ncbi:MAG TPA: right-handed parallel beta-helix repeat-containing protein [Gemmatimonadales bacterium]|nr:right-handed parallel beta-helix repeat-containing protein [Gemmatimonadales bacterium]